MNDVRNAPAFSHGYNAPGHLYQAKQDDRHRGDPRYDPEARMRKIEALKVICFLSYLTRICINF